MANLEAGAPLGLASSCSGGPHESGLGATNGTEKVAMTKLISGVCFLRVVLVLVDAINTNQ